MAHLRPNHFSNFLINVNRILFFFFFILSQDLQTTFLNQAAYFATGSVYPHSLFTTTSSSTTPTSNNSTFIHH